MRGTKYEFIVCGASIYMTLQEARDVYRDPYCPDNIREALKQQIDKIISDYVCY